MNAHVGSNTVPNIETFDVLTHFYNFTYHFMARNKLDSRVSVSFRKMQFGFLLGKLR